MRYAAEQDRSSKLITHLMICLALLVGARQVFTGSAHAMPANIMLIMLILALATAWCYSPKYYLLTATSIIIKGHLRSIIIPLDEVLRLRSVEEEELGESMRIFASGGIFGYVGSYRSVEIGDYQRWCTNSEHLVLIESAKKKWVISPSNAAEFVRAVNRIINAVH